MGVVCVRPSPTPVKTDRAVRIQETNQVKVNSSSINQSINWEVYNESLRLIGWFDPLSEKLPHGDDFRVGPNSDQTPRDNTVSLKDMMLSLHDFVAGWDRGKFFGLEPLPKNNSSPGT